MASGCGDVGSEYAPREVMAAEPLDGREVSVFGCFFHEVGVVTNGIWEGREEGGGEDSVSGEEVLDAERMGKGSWYESYGEGGARGDDVFESWEGGGEGARAGVEFEGRGEEGGGGFEGVVETGAGHGEPDAVFDANAEEDEVDDIRWEIEEREGV